MTTPAASKEMIFAIFSEIMHELSFMTYEKYCIRLNLLKTFFMQTQFASRPA